MRFRKRRQAFAVTTISGLIIILYLTFHRHSSVISKEIQFRGIIDHELRNCSCSVKYIKDRHPNGSIIRAEQVKIGGKSWKKKANITGTPAYSNDIHYLQEPIDKHVFNYIHNPEKTCFHENGTEMDVYLVFFVLSAPGNFEQRESIRMSYGNRETWPSIGGAQVVTVFMLASTSTEGMGEKIDAESDRHGDIVQESFVDSYVNLTRKTIMGLKWVSNHCGHAQFAMKIDDDTAVIQRRLLEVLHDAPHTGYASGYVFKEPIVMRDKQNKFYLSKKYYPDDHFPSYPNGHGYVMTNDVVDAAFNVAITTPLFPWEDVFFGICLRKLNITLRHDAKFFYWGKYTSLLSARMHRKAGRYVIATDIPPKDMVRFYQRFLISNYVQSSNQFASYFKIVLLCLGILFCIYLIPVVTEKRKVRKG
ncbi:beta-1,3-galactosyltransferase 5-like [Lytechinus variegatus]|uniref:beta-1,3-galactosyltransferase 5-like n=1 Tax=Lytechinus variegatus TaxID=7654 RepID=UPI001BB13BE9|nr:beta-1,3-galactosyltransferase 5-like [Lytechinus variegatus]